MPNIDLTTAVYTTVVAKHLGGNHEMQAWRRVGADFDRDIRRQTGNAGSVQREHRKRQLRCHVEDRNLDKAAGLDD